VTGSAGRTATNAAGYPFRTQTSITISSN
jgi:hypothetical protein